MKKTILIALLGIALGGCGSSGGGGDAGGGGKDLASGGGKDLAGGGGNDLAGGGGADAGGTPVGCSGMYSGDYMGMITCTLTFSSSAHSLFMFSGTLSGNDVQNPWVLSADVTGPLAVKSYQITDFASLTSSITPAGTNPADPTEYDLGYSAGMMMPGANQSATMMITDPMAPHGTFSGKLGRNKGDGWVMVNLTF